VIHGACRISDSDTEQRLPDRGGIALQLHGEGDFTNQFVRYRNIRVRELGSQPAPDAIRCGGG
jgi:hypothetical protein